MTETDSIQGKARSRKWLKWLLLVPLALLVPLRDAAYVEHRA